MLLINKPLPVKLPVVCIFCDPKSGEIFVPSIAALAFISALTIVPLAIFPAITDPLCNFALETVLSLGVPIDVAAPIKVRN